jgi:hypothetical protein
MSSSPAVEATERATHAAEAHRTRAHEVLERPALIGGLAYSEPAAVLADLAQAAAEIDAAASLIRATWPDTGKAAAA